MRGAQPLPLGGRSSGIWLAYPEGMGYDSLAMLSRAQEARVRGVLANHPPGTIQTYCLEHLAAAAQIPLGHGADLAAFVRGLRERARHSTEAPATHMAMRRNSS